MASKLPTPLLHRASAPSIRSSATRGVLASSRLSCRHASSRNTDTLRTTDRDSSELPAQSSENDTPRWTRTPPAMVAPVRARPVPLNNDFKVNSDPQKLDEVYVKMLGSSGDRMLSEETKWLAVTHKSFDHGRRGFNDRLTLLGKRIIDLQTSLALLNAPQPSRQDPNASSADRYGRIPFTHPQLSGLSNLSHKTKSNILDETRLANLAKKYGLSSVVRWKPKSASNLHASGEDVVLTGALFAIIGAVALERGGGVANRVVKEKILTPLGLS